MSSWFDDLARDLGDENRDDRDAGRRTRRRILRNLLGSVAATSPLALAAALPVVAAKCKSNKDCGSNKRCRDGKCEPDRCKNDYDCGSNKRCRNGDCERMPDTGGANGNWENAGRSSREQGVKDWKVERQGGGYNVEFRHQDERYSGTLNVNYDGGGQTGTTVLKRGNARFQLAFSGDRIAATDAAGQGMVANWDNSQEQWKMDAASERWSDANKIDLRLSFAIAGDLADGPPKDRAVALSGDVDVAAAQATECRENVYITGRSTAWQRPLACDWATQAANYDCGKMVGGLCSKCCRVLNDCGCVCMVGDLGCHCSLIGHPYWPGQC